MQLNPSSSTTPPVISWVLEVWTAPREQKMPQQLWYSDTHKVIRRLGAYMSMRIFKSNLHWWEAGFPYREQEYLDMQRRNEHNIVFHRLSQFHSIVCMYTYTYIHTYIHTYIYLQNLYLHKYLYLRIPFPIYIWDYLSLHSKTSESNVIPQKDLWHQ